MEDVSRFCNVYVDLDFQVCCQQNYYHLHCYWQFTCTIAYLRESKCTLNFLHAPAIYPRLHDIKLDINKKNKTFLGQMHFDDTKKIGAKIVPASSLFQRIEVLLRFVFIRLLVLNFQLA